MKKLMILAVAMVAMAFSNVSEAAFRVSISDGTNTATYYIGSSSPGGSGGTIALPSTGSLLRSDNWLFNTDGYSGGSLNLISTNWPGVAQVGSITTSLTLYSRVGVSTVKGLTVTMAVVDQMTGGIFDTANSVMFENTGFLLTNAESALLDLQPMSLFTVPTGSGLTAVASLTSTNGSTSNPVTSGMAHAEIYIKPDGSPVLPALVTNSVSLVASQTITPSWQVGATIPATGYNLTQMLIMTDITLNSGNVLNGQVFSVQSSVQPLVPEPTSLALAGFAGIGMAVGAIRRRRQAKQAA
ncbi:PEP-CTERM sorting domain-containing protein [Planctellipticum variicoloris]|uniref:PEP-CTERM sorting domain-containing protein n=1 Tax=Planctellipticum variicoloris TaxID=3064265 RepID=UPI0030135C95|nr:PEP-CTERM sorting domain-containing protein [Planctomycetaceae bacterium SH412]